MDKKLQAVRGMNDLLADQVPYWQLVERAARELFADYGYREMRVPLLERAELFQRSIGEHTDIVEKEMYTFEDRGGDLLSLRPEATAGLVRAAIEHGLLHNQKQRLWTSGPMFRHERPQAGRYRQFHQIDCEAFGYPGPDIDGEMIQVSARLWRKLTVGLSDEGQREAALAFLAGLVDAQGRAFYRVDPGLTLGLTLADEAVTAERLATDTVGGDPIRRYVELTDAYTGTHDARGVFFAVGPGVAPGLRLPCANAGCLNRAPS